MQPTPRETQILDLLLYGRTNKEIAIVLGISPHTVRDHLSQLMLRYRVPSRCALAALYAKHCATPPTGQPAGDHHINQLDTTLQM